MYDPKQQQKSKSISSPEQNYLSLFAMRYPVFELRCLCVFPFVCLSVFLQIFFFRLKWIKFANSVNRHLEFQNSSPKGLKAICNIKVKLFGPEVAKLGCNIFFSMKPILFLYYEESLVLILMVMVILSRLMYFHITYLIFEFKIKCYQMSHNLLDNLNSLHHSFVVASQLLLLLQCCRFLKNHSYITLA